MRRPGRLVVCLTLLIAGVGFAGCAPKAVIIETPKETHNINYVLSAMSRPNRGWATRRKMRRS